MVNYEIILEKAERLASHVLSVVPYIEATINNPKILDKSEWFPIHSGRASSSKNQLRNIELQAEELLRLMKSEDT